MLSWLFPEKFNFVEEYNKNPTSERTIKAFLSVGDKEVQEYFNYKSHGLDWLLNNSDRNNFEYTEILVSLIERLEEAYSEKAEAGIAFYFEAEDVASRKVGLFNSELNWFQAARIALVNYENICRHLHRQPVSELVEDCFEIQAKRHQISIEKEKEKEKLNEVKRLDFQKKQNFLHDQIDGLEKENKKRSEIKEELEKKFLNLFSSHLKSVVRMNGIWTIKFENMGTIETVVIKPRPWRDLE
tara:strand:- start:130 stop:855 length:726 start_codon:yes stop_codon:yes gene_type:complete